MRIRTLLLILAIVLVAGFVMLNLDEFTRSSTLSLGFTTVQVALGMVMLLMLGVAVVVFLLTTLLIQSSNMLEARNYTRALETQRELADKAEASRFTELRNYMEVESSAALQRESTRNAALQEQLAAQHQSMLTRLQETENVVAANVGQLEDKLERRLG